MTTVGTTAGAGAGSTAGAAAGTTPRRTGGGPRRLRRDDGAWQAVGAVFLVAVAVVYGLPLLWMVFTSFKPAADLADATWWPTTWTGEAYRSFVTTDFLPALRNSASLSLTATALTMLLAIPAAYGLSRSRSRLITPAMILLLVVQMIPTSATFIPLFRLLAQLELVNTHVGVALAQCTLFVPFAVLILRPAFGGIPVALEEAARIDGAGSLRYLLLIAIPLLRNTLIVATAIVLVSSWGELVYPLTFLLDQDKYPLSVYIAQSVGRFNNTWNLLMAVAVTAALPVLLVVLAAQRRLQSGITLGAVK